MAAILSVSPLIEPSRSAKVPISIGNSFLGNGQGNTQRNASVQCRPSLILSTFTWLTGTGNYKPTVQPHQTTRIRFSQRPSKSHVDLTIKNRGEGGQYEYTGSQQASKVCALVYNPSTKAMVLEKLDVDFTFNLQTSPSNRDRNEVTSQYPQLITSVSDNESEDGNHTGSATHGTEPTGPDMSNPYDYRHFLKRRRTDSPETEAPQSRPSVSPAVPSRRLSRTSARAKPRPRPMQRSKRPLPPPGGADAKQDSDDSDDGGLTIEMGDDPKPRRFGNGAVVFNHDKRNGPISLRSAASSMSPASMKHDSSNENAESDKDVEHFELPSPAGGSNGYNVEENDADDDDDDDVVDDLIEAMESQAEEDAADAVARAVKSQPIRSTVEESSSESEEE
ncbi:MAG: hypothetical protein Q9205_003420 [Flavoplaca limonia]